MNNIININTEKLYDVIVIGGGPAGLTAAIYLARAKYRVLVLEKEAFGGQITITHEVVNYPGVGKISGKELCDTMHAQAESFGAEFMIAEAQKLDMNGDIKTVRTSIGELYSFGVLLATGAHPRSVGFKGEEKYKGRGVAYCATCDGEFFTGKDVFVIGGGFAAAEESVFLTKFARQVTILVREEDFTCAASVADEARNHPKIKVITNTVVEEVSGEKGLDYIRYKNTADGTVTEFRAKNGESFGVFVFVGYAPETSLAENLAELDKYGYVVTDRTQKTSIDGLYAAGDVCIKPLRQVVTATGDGALAATELEKYALAMQRKTGLHPTFKEQTKTEAPNTETTSDSGGIFTPEMRAELDPVFEKMARPLLLKLYLDNRPVSGELEKFVTELAGLSSKLEMTVEERSADSQYAPSVRVCLYDGSETGLAFHGVPGGHEFTSFILGLYNAAGPGQAVDEKTLKAVRALEKKLEIKVLVTLSCSMCPELVVAAERAAAENPNITADVYDIAHFDALREKYNVMSVPCMVINNEHVSFGKKNLASLVEMLKEI